MYYILIINFKIYTNSFFQNRESILIRINCKQKLVQLVWILNSHACPVVFLKILFVEKYTHNTYRKYNAWICTVLPILTFIKWSVFKLVCKLDHRNDFSGQCWDNDPEHVLRTLSCLSAVAAFTVCLLLHLHNSMCPILHPFLKTGIFIVPLG